MIASDIENIKKCFSSDIKIIDHKEISEEELINKIEKYLATDNVILWFTGHGTNEPEKGAFPSIKLGNEYVSTESIKEKIVGYIQKKLSDPKPFFGFIVDACNNRQTKSLQHLPMDMSPHLKRCSHDSLKINDNYIFSCSASYPRQSVGDMYGSYFTTKLLFELSFGASFQAALQETQKQLSGSVDQCPIYRIGEYHGNEL